MRILTAKDFGAMIRKKRKHLGYNQQDLADITGLSTSFISNLENGKETAELGKALFLANILGLDLYIEDRAHEI